MEDIIEPKLINTLLSRKEIILEKWIELILVGYHAEGAKFFGENNDPFRNPVGTTIKGETESKLSQLLKEMDSALLEKSLDKIIRIRSIQEFSASEAVSFIFLLKQVISEEIITDNYKDIDAIDILDIYTRVDKIVLMAFDIYMQNREQIFNIKINEIKKRSTFVNMDRKPKRNDV